MLEMLTTSLHRFGLLHRIPTPPSDRQPGTIPPELSEPSDEYEEQQLFVPAEIGHQEPDTPEVKRREFLASRFQHERSLSSDTETENHTHGREVEVHTPTPQNHGRVPFLGTARAMRSPTPTRAASGSFTNGDSAPHS